MNNNTKIRLHLSKQLFESLTRQVLAEAKKDVKMPTGKTTKKDGAVSKKQELPVKKKPSASAAEKKTPDIKKTGAMRKINEKEQMGGSKSPEQKKTSRMASGKEKK